MPRIDLEVSQEGLLLEGLRSDLHCSGCICTLRQQSHELFN